MSEQPLMNYEPAPTPFTEETDVLLNAADPRLSSVPAARALVEATKRRRLEEAQSPERLPDYRQLAVVTKNVKTIRDYELAA